MKTPFTFTFLILNVTFGTLLSQETQLFEPINYKQAIENGTRIREGKPGPNYWQNHADYDIEVKLDTAERKIYGKETVTYCNESPDIIKNLVLRLYQNKYKKGAVRNEAIVPENIHDGMQLDTLIINGKGMVINDKTSYTNGTNLFLFKIDSIAPKGKLELFCSWNYKIPSAIGDFRRTGYYKDNAWFIGYFYPQIAVYDDLERFWRLKGWDYALFHQGWQEFYNDFNNFKVQIEVPKGFYVWATGTLANQNELYSKELLDKINKAHHSNENIKILSKDKSNQSQLLNNVWKYEAKNVSDFGFGTATNYIWEASSVEVGNKRVFVDVAYHPDSKTFQMTLDIAKEAVSYASKVYPAIEFPYAHATTFNGMYGGGMEFPMIANNAEVDSTLIHEITYHEIFHNYTPFMLGLNEKRYPFMDEGLTQYFTDHYLLNVQNDDKFFGIGNIVEFFNQYAHNDDNPIINSAYLLSTFNMSYYYYIKPNIAYRFFAEMVGEDNFKKAFQKFANIWKGKHPTPYDFFYTVNHVLGENYNWFWKAWFFDFGYPDLALEQKGEDLIIRRVGVGSLPVPIKLKVEHIDGSNSTIEKSMAVWKNGAKEISIPLNNKELIKSISVDTKKVPDIDTSNNFLMFNN